MTDWEDGAHQGIKANDAMKAAIGDEAEPEMMDVRAFEEYIRTAPDNPADYNDTARVCAKIFLEWILAHPEDGQLPLDNEWEDFDGKPYYSNPDPSQWVRKQWGLYDKIKDSSPAMAKRLEDLGLTGFQAGWAFNAARRCCELPPAQNPALVTIGGD